MLMGTTLSSVEADFEAAQLDAGGVVLIGGVVHEVLAVLDAETLSVSLPRARLTQPPIPGREGTDLEVVVRSFEPQAALVHDGLLRLLGIDPDDEAAALTEESVVSLSVMARLEALGTLERIYSGAVALVGDNDM